MRKPVSLFICCLFCFNSISFAGNNFFFSPGLTVGYTLGAGTNWGFMFDTGLTGTIKGVDVKYGTSIFWYYISVQSSATRHYKHRARSLFGCLMLQTDFVDLKAGLGRMKNPWGNDNKCIVHGFTADVSFAYPSVYSPWIGFKTFRYNRESWAWFSDPYHTLYVKYKYDVIQNTGLKKL
jgi:hypothetical protein